MKDDDSSPDSKEDFAIDQEDDNSVKNQKRKAELKRLEKCFEIIKHEIRIRHRLILLDKFYALKKELI
jgi:hypothetical protein